MCWSRRYPWTRMLWAVNDSASCSAVTSSASGPSLSSGGPAGTAPSAGVVTHHTPARRSVPASVSSSAGWLPWNTNRAWPLRGLADCLTSTSSRPPCIRWTTNVTGSKRNSRYLPRRPTSSSGCPYAVEGAEHWLGVDQLLLVAGEADAALDERLLGGELMGGDGDGGVPVLLHA